MVIFDDGNHILKTLDFPQPVEWLTTQLDRDSNLWDRQWVIAQLGKARNATAVAAISNAGTSADYFLTRVHAAAALGAIPAEAATPALLAMVKDTSSQVRSAAVASLGRIGGAAAIAAIRAAFDDPSYAVKSAAVNALVRTDSAHASDVVRRALHTASYQDAVRNSALLATVNTGDPSFVVDVTAMLGDDVRSAIALARMTARGNETAGRALADALNDSRPYIRAWAVSAYQSIPPAMAIPRLQAAAGSLKYADTRERVNNLIVQMQKRQKP
jgi:HEAT repeat protein